MKIMDDTNSLSAYSYKSLDDIEARKAQLRRDLRKDSQRMEILFGRLFPKTPKDAVSSPSKRMQRIFNTGAGVIDGALLGWKLYRKFKKRKRF